jgi:hypothetical protein
MKHKKNNLMEVNMSEIGPESDTPIDDLTDDLIKGTAQVLDTIFPYRHEKSDEYDAIIKANEEFASLCAVYILYDEKIEGKKDLEDTENLDLRLLIKKAVDKSYEKKLISSEEKKFLIQN